MERHLDLRLCSRYKTDQRYNNNIADDEKRVKTVSKNSERTVAPPATKMHSGFKLHHYDEKLTSPTAGLMVIGRRQ